MIEHLSTLIKNFSGAANQTRCFTHILNLVAKSILRQFNTPKKAADGDSGDFDDATGALAALAQELEDNEAVADDGTEEGNDDDEAGGEDDNEDGLGDEHDGMSDAEVAELEESLVPIRLMLAKASQFKLCPKLSNSVTKLRALANAIKNSSTIILPQWLEKLEDLQLRVQMMPHDVSTCWNSTFDMLDFALDYHLAIDSITSNRELNLRKYELQDDEWAVAENL
jgi:hypothetical protein